MDYETSGNQEPVYPGIGPANTNPKPNLGTDPGTWIMSFFQLAECTQIICMTICRQLEKWPRCRLNSFLNGSIKVVCRRCKLLYLQLLY